MTVTPRPTRRRSPRRLLALVAASALLASLLVPTATEAKPRPPTTQSATTKAKTAASPAASKAKAARAKAAKARAAAKAKAAALADASPPATDNSGGLPRLHRSGTTGDFLGRGYEQRAIVENYRLNIYDTPDRGGGLLRSTPTDLGIPPVQDVLGAFDPDYGLSAIYLRWTPTGLYMSGSQGDPFGVDYKIVLYRLAADGTCATRACATWVKDDFDTRRPSELPGLFVMSIMSMAYGVIGEGAAAKPVLAVGLSASGAGDVPSYPSGRMDQQGVWILDAATGVQLGTTYNDYVSPGVDTFPVPALDLAWDPRGSGLLSIVIFSSQAIGNSVMVSSTGTFSGRTFWDYEPTTESGVILSTAVGYLADGSTTVIAFGLVDGSTRLWNPATTTSNTAATYTAASDPVNAVTFVDRVTGPAGAQDVVAISTENDKARVLRYDGTSTLKPQFLAPGGQAADLATDVGGIQSWYPGYKAGRLKITAVNPDEDLTVSFAARGVEGYGCWFGPAFPGALAFPTTGSITMAAGGSTTGLYTIGGLTAATSGNCDLASDSVGEWASYLLIAPTSRPAERSTVKLVIGRDGTPTVTVVGGSITATATSTTSSATPGYPLGETTLTVTTPPTATPAKPLKPTAVQVNDLDPTRPVYRIDLPSSTWTLPPSTPGRISAELEPLQVYGSTSPGGEPTLLGLLAPEGFPSRAATSGTITLAPVSFYWQNPAPGEGPIITTITITNPDENAPVSATVDLSQIGPPSSEGATITAVYICPANGTQNCDGTAAPYANGLDQAAVKIKVVGANGTLPTSDPAYGRIFYRDADGNLITGLIPTDGSPWTRISPYRGAYPNDGSTKPPIQPGRVGGQYGYLSTTDTGPQTVTGWVGNYDPSNGGSNGGNMAVDGGLPSSLQVTGSSVSQGFSLTKCSGDFSDHVTCAIAQPQQSSTGSTPVLYYTTDPVSGDLKIGLQFQNRAQTALTSLPLQQLAGQGEHTVADAPLTITAGEVTFAGADTSFQPADDVDVWLVVHGQQIKVPPVNVGQAN